MKILHLGDLHIGKKVNGYSMIEDQKYVFNQVYEVIKKEKIETVIIAGDIYDRSIPTEESVELFDEFLINLINELKVKVIAVSGNHDSSARLNFSRKILEKQGLYILGEYKKIVNRVSIEEIDFYLMPYVAPGVIRNRFNNQNISTYDETMQFITEKISEEINRERVNIGIYHGFVIGRGEKEEDVVKEESVKLLSVGGKESVSSSYFEIFDYTALGHLHGNRKAGSEKIRYSGSPLKYSFSEENQKKVFQIVDINKGSLDLKEIEIRQRYEMHTLKGSFDEIMKKEIPNDSYLRVILTENVLEAMSKLRTRYRHVMELSFEIPKVDKQKSKIDIRNIDKIEKSDLFREFALEDGILLSEKYIEKVKQIMNSTLGGK